MDLQQGELTHGQLVGGGWRGGRERSKVCLATFTSPYWEITYHNCSYIDLGCLAESSHGMHVVVQDDDPHHDPHAEHQRFFTGKPTPVFRSFQHDFTNTCHRTEAVCGVLYWQGFVFGDKVHGGVAEGFQHRRGFCVEQGHSIGHLIVDFILNV